MKKSVIGIVHAQANAERIVEDVQRAGVLPGDVSVIMPDTSGTRDFAHEHNTKAPEGAVAGVGAGGVIGGTIGLLAGIGALAIPGVGPFIAAGPLLAALSGAAAGATVGGVTGALIGLGIPEIEAKTYEGKLKDGNILVAVHVENDDVAKRVKTVFVQHQAHDIAITNDAAVPKEQRAAVR